MGLIPYILRSFVHLAFVVADILMVAILIKVTYDRWKLPWLKPLATMVEPPVKSILDSLGTWLSRKTGKSYTEKMRIILLIFGLTFVRLVICALV